MPTYQYACTNPDCGERFERVQAFTDAAVTECPVCGQAVRKVYGSVGVVFKGSGFYRNDSRSGSNGGDSLSPKESGSSKESGSGDSGSGSKESGSSTKDSTSSKDSGSSSGSTSSGSKESSSSSSGSGASTSPSAASS